MQRASIVRLACQQILRPSRVCASRINTQGWYHRPSRVPRASRIATGCQIRHLSSESEPTYRPLTNRSESDEEEAARRKAEVETYRAEQPSYQLTFTCGKCMDRSSHRISKQGYHHGTVLVNCPGCKNKHLISDHLKIFSDRGITLEDIMKEKGELLKKGVLGADGDVEFYSEEQSQPG